MKQILIVLALMASISLKGQQQQTTVNGWNAFVHLPDDYSSTQVGYPAIIYFPPIGGVGTNAGAVLEYGPGAYIASGWNGNITVNGVTVKFIVVSVQPRAAYPTAQQLKDCINAITARYRISYINLTGIGHGGVCVSTLVTAYPFIAKTVSNVVETKTCCWKSYYAGDPYHFGGQVQSLYEWMARKNAFGTVAIGPGNTTTPTIRKPQFFYDNPGRRINLKMTRPDNYSLYNMLGQLTLRGKLNVGDNQISVTGLSTGIYVLKTDQKLFKITIQ